MLHCTRYFGEQEFCDHFIRVPEIQCNGLSVHSTNIFAIDSNADVNINFRYNVWPKKNKVIQ